MLQEPHGKADWLDIYANTCPWSSGSIFMQQINYCMPIKPGFKQGKQKLLLSNEPLFNLKFYTWYCTWKHQECEILQLLHPLLQAFVVSLVHMCSQWTYQNFNSTILSLDFNTYIVTVVNYINSAANKLTYEFIIEG